MWFCTPNDIQLTLIGHRTLHRWGLRIKIPPSISPYHVHTLLIVETMYSYLSQNRVVHSKNQEALLPFSRSRNFLFNESYAVWTSIFCIIKSFSSVSDLFHITCMYL